ncbi:MAG: gamma carbonic anhydrase family protein [Alphaproteobacteria bacterium]|nr:gamma carbonic anhydrase family protein [Alphaproteobacteria bacterium]
MTALVQHYLEHGPSLGNGVLLSDKSVVVGRATLDEGVALSPFAVIRADGHTITIGEHTRYLDRATAHIADGFLPAQVGKRVLVGRYALTHACTIGDDCILADGAVVMDGAVVGDGAVIAAGALVPPGKTLEGGKLYAGNPARPIGDIGPDDLVTWRGAVITGRSESEHDAFALPPLDMAPFAPEGEGPLYPLGGGAPAIDPAAFVAPGSVVAGNVSVGGGSSIWYATVCRAEGGPIAIGPETSVQDNTIMLTGPGSGPITVGRGVTIGHNVRMGSCTVGNDCVIGMGCEMADGVVVEDGAIVGARAYVEPGTVVKAGHIWAGRPAKEFRPVSDQERSLFARGKAVYVAYAAKYLAQAAA